MSGELTIQGAFDNLARVSKAYKGTHEEHVILEHSRTLVQNCIDEKLRLEAQVKILLKQVEDRDARMEELEVERETAKARPS